MKRLTIILLVICSVISFQNDLVGQHISGLDPEKCPSERIILHLSQESPFAGEILWFRVYCTSAVFPAVEISSVAFVELVSPENTSVIRKKILLDQGLGDGELNIPPDLPTGLYYVIAYTSWMKNFNESLFFRKAVAIVNPDQPYKLAAGSSDSARIQNINLTQDKYSTGLTLKTDKPLYSSREKVTVTIQLADSDTKLISGNFSLSVSRKEPQMVFQVSHAIHEPYSSITEDKLWLPDHNGIRLSGNLSDATGKGVSEARLIMSEPGPGTDLESSITNENGDFSFLLGMGTGDKDIIITLPSSEMKLSLEEPFWNGFRKMPDDLILQISAKMIPYLRDKFVHLQLQNRFRNDFYEKISPFSARRDTTVFYSKPYQTYMIGNYIALDSLAEYFHELIPSVKFVRRRGEVEISVTDPSTMSEIPEKPGVFLDGVPYNNFSGIADIPANEIDRITVIPAVYYYKDFTFGGIIDIHTMKSDFNSVKMLPEMIRFIYPEASQRGWKLSSPDYSGQVVNTKIPDFRYLLAWEPGISIRSGAIETFQFYTGDLDGDYVITVTGISGDGEILHSEYEITVGKPSQ